MMQYFEWNLPNDGKLWTQLKEDARLYCTPKVGHFWGVFYEI